MSTKAAVHGGDVPTSADARSKRIRSQLAELARNDGIPRTRRQREVKQRLGELGNLFCSMIGTGEVDIAFLAAVVNLDEELVTELILTAIKWRLPQATHKDGHE